MLVVAETFDAWSEHKLPQDYSVYFEQQWREDLTTMVLSARNHPSIIMWSIGNEIPDWNTHHGVETQWQLANEVHRLDPSRPVTAAINDFVAIDEAMKFYAALGKHPIELHRERPGHLANRLQAALWREAVDAVASGQASVEDVDAAVTLALGPRWALNGPFATFHLGGGEGGLQHFIDHLGPALEALWDDAQRPLMTVQLQRQLVSAIATRFAGRSLRDVTTERDTRLRAILSLTQQPLPESGNG